jgi:protein tyrosine/serine phosphatase
MGNYNNFSKNNEITNFREICLGNIYHGILYRGSYPVFNIDKERDKIYEKLVFEAGIKCVLNLADNEAGLERIAQLVTWYHKLLKKNNVMGLDIQFEFDFENKAENDIFKNKLKQGFQFLIRHDGPYLIHCNAGIDRTGFVAAIIELLFGASIDEVIYDYILSYGKEFADAKETELKIETGNIIFNQMDTIIHNKIEEKDNLQKNIEKYFIEDIGLTMNELSGLKNVLTGRTQHEKQAGHHCDR